MIQTIINILYSILVSLVRGIISFVHMLFLPKPDYEVYCRENAWSAYCRRDHDLSCKSDLLVGYALSGTASYRFLKERFLKSTGHFSINKK